MGRCERDIDCLHCNSRGMCSSYALFMYNQGKNDERQKIMDMIDEGDDMYNAMALLSEYLISEKLKESNSNI